jgi:hypothetical protein
VCSEAAAHKDERPHPRTIVVGLGSLYDIAGKQLGGGDEGMPRPPAPDVLTLVKVPAIIS